MDKLIEELTALEEAQRAREAAESRLLSARDEGLEEAALVAMEHVAKLVAAGLGEKARTAGTIADAIRALKSTPSTHE